MFGSSDVPWESGTELALRQSADPNEVFRNILSIHKVLYRKSLASIGGMNPEEVERFIRKCIENSPRIHDISERIRLADMIRHWISYAYGDSGVPVLTMAEPEGGHYTFRTDRDRLDPWQTNLDWIYGFGLSEHIMQPIKTIGALIVELLTTDIVGGNQIHMEPRELSDLGSEQGIREPAIHATLDSGGRVLVNDVSEMIIEILIEAGIDGDEARQNVIELLPTENQIKLTVE